MNRILVVEDDDELGEQIAEDLDAAGYATTWVKTGEDALLELPEPYSLMILDLMLPGAHGLDVLKQVRERTNAELPVLILTARNETADKVRALKLGADDYLTKPFWPEELLARVEARLRRPALKQGESLSLGGNLTLDLATRSAAVKEGVVELTPVEFNILSALARRPGTPISRRWLVDNVLDSDGDRSERTLNVHVSRLRKKLGTVGERIATVWGVGYRLQPPE